MHKKVDVEKLSDDAILNAAARLFPHYVEEVKTTFLDEAVGKEPDVYAHLFASFFHQLKISLLDKN